MSPIKPEYSRKSPPLRYVAQQLLKHYGKLPWFEKWDPFVMLIQTILSQHTNDKNRDYAFSRLQKTLPITPSDMVDAPLKTIQTAIRSAGLWRIKAKRIREVSQAVIDNFNSDLEKIIKQPLDEARSALLSLPGVGYKTADILLLFYGRQLVIPLDTHCLRLTQRLGYGDGKNYEATRKRLLQELPNDPDTLFQFHTGLITHGRQICNARNPKCSQCFLQKKCPSAEFFLTQASKLKKNSLK